MSTQSQSHSPVQCMMLKCPEWEERGTQEVHKRSKIFVVTQSFMAKTNHQTTSHDHDCSRMLPKTWDFPILSTMKLVMPLKPHIMLVLFLPNAP